MMMTTFSNPNLGLKIPTTLRNLNSSKNGSSNSKSRVNTVLKPTLLPHGYKPQDRDVMCGRLSNNHAGNRYFRHLIGMYMIRYMKAPNRQQKSNLVARIVELVRHSGGRFIKQDDSNDQWFDIGDKLAKEKCGHAIRDMISHHYHNPNGAAVTTTRNSTTIRENSQSMGCSSGSSSNSSSRSSSPTSGTHRAAEPGDNIIDLCDESSPSPALSSTPLATGTVEKTNPPNIIDLCSPTEIGEEAEENEMLSHDNDTRRRVLMVKFKRPKVTRNSPRPLGTQQEQSTMVAASQLLAQDAFQNKTNSFVLQNGFTSSNQDLLTSILSLKPDHQQPVPSVAVPDCAQLQLLQQLMLQQQKQPLLSATPAGAIPHNSNASLANRLLTMKAFNNFPLDALAYTGREGQIARHLQQKLI